MFSSSFSPNSISLKLSSSRKRGSILLFLLFLGIFLVGGKSWAVDCGEQYAGKYGTCKKTVGFTSLSCPDNWFSWSFTSSLATCASDEKCCIQETTCNTNWDECVFEGEKGLCENGACVAGKEPAKPTNQPATNCGDDKKGTCQVAQGTSKDECPTDWSTHPEGTKNVCQPSGWTKTICCIADGDVCAGKNEGATCKTNDKNGNCVGGKCVISSAKPGESCGNGGICIQTGTPQYVGCVGVYFYGNGGRGCDGSAYVCCKISSIPKTSCGTNGGYCSASTECDTGYQKDSGGASTCSPNPCCYKPPANPGAAPKAFGYANPLNNIKTFTAWAEKVLTSIQGIVGWLAVIMIMIGGIVYLTSAGTKSATLGREIITAALIGFAAAVAGPSLLKEIKDLVSGTGTTATGAIDSAKDIKSIFTSALNFLLIAMGTLSLIGFVIGGFFYLTAFGDKSRAETGRKIATNSLYAIALAGGGLILVKQILSLLGS